jgi:hypothetical protein
MVRGKPRSRLSSQGAKRSERRTAHGVIILTAGRRCDFKPLMQSEKLPAKADENLCSY